MATSTISPDIPRPSRRRLSIVLAAALLVLVAVGSAAAYSTLDDDSANGTAPDRDAPTGSPPAQVGIRLDDAVVFVPIR